MSDWAIGLSTGCFWQTSIFDCLEPIRNSGFDRLEICSHPAHLDYHHRDTVRRARQRIHELGLEAYSFHAPFAPAIDITSLDESSRDFAMAELIEAAEAAALLEVRYLVLHPGPENSILPEHERFVRLQNAVEVLNRFYHHCRRLGIGRYRDRCRPCRHRGHRGST